MEHFTPKILTYTCLAATVVCLAYFIHHQPFKNHSSFNHTHKDEKTVSLNIMMNYVQIVTERYSGGLPGGEQNEENSCLLF